MLKEPKNLLAQAVHNENDGIYNGNGGSQTGLELNCTNPYEFSWNYIYRAKDDVVKEKIASFMEKAVANGYIGYDTNKTKRDTLFNNLVELNFNVDRLNKLSMCDCTSLIGTAVYSAIKVPYTPILDTEEKTPRGRNFESYFMGDCNGLFQSMKFDSYVTWGEGVQLVRGDILNKLIDNGDGTYSGHACVFI